MHPKGNLDLERITHGSITDSTLKEGKLYFVCTDRNLSPLHINYDFIARVDVKKMSNSSSEFDFCAVPERTDWKQMRARAMHVSNQKLFFR